MSEQLAELSKAAAEEKALLEKIHGVIRDNDEWLRRCRLDRWRDAFLASFLTATNLTCVFLVDGALRIFLIAVVAFVAGTAVFRQFSIAGWISNCLDRQKRLEALRKKQESVCEIHGRLVALLEEETKCNSENTA